MGLSSDGMAEKAGHYDSIDLMKFILALMVVLIHVNPFPPDVNAIVMPVLRLAVPLFFITSAFFFFRKVRVGKNSSESDIIAGVKRAVHFTRRNLGLYFFWLAVLLVPVILFRGWFKNGLLWGFFTFVKHFFFGSTFIASWYIMALVISIWVVLILSVKLSSTTVVVMTSPFFIVSCLMSNYYYSPLTQAHLGALQFAFWFPYNSFWIGLFWVAVGKWLSDHFEAWGGVASCHLLGITTVGLLLLGCEQAYIVQNGYCYDSSVFFSLPIVVVPLFLLFLRWDIAFSGTAFLRAASTITYCLHATLRSILKAVFLLFGVQASELMLLGPVVVICLLLSVVILRLERYPKLTWLRFAH